MKLRWPRAVIPLALSTSVLAFIACSGESTTFTTSPPDGGGDDGFDSGAAPRSDRADSGDMGRADSGSTDGSIEAGPPLYTVSARIDGLTDAGGGAPQGLVLRNNGGDELRIPADGTYAFSRQLRDGAAYSVTIYQTPKGRSCSVDNGSGKIASTNATVGVHCVAAYTIGGEVRGLTPAAGGQPAQGLVIQNNAGDDVSITNDGPFSFPHELPNGATYSVSIKTQPAARNCKVTSGSGTVQGASVTSVQVSCNAS